jgi:hypothetical protein
MKQTMRKIEDLTGEEVIHCSTEGEWVKVRALQKVGFKCTPSCWEEHREDTCYLPLRGTFGSLGDFQEEGYTIYPASDFLEPEFEWGEKIEVRDFPLDQWETEFFVGMNPALCNIFKYITTSNVGTEGSYKYARKIQRPNPIPEYTMEELQEKLGEEFKIKK